MNNIFDGKFSWSFSYGDLIEEIQEELEDECLAHEDTVFVLRIKSGLQAEHFGESFRSPYRPVIDWFYKREESDAEERDFLEEISVKDFMEEMKTWNRIL